jgi:hypothetical protein
LTGCTPSISPTGRRESPARTAESYCPNLAELAQTGVDYLQAFNSRPSDSFPGLIAQITGTTPRSAGIYYDVDLSLSAPARTTPYGIVEGASLCPATKGRRSARGLI